jgi:lipopolysaccharide transport system ATP-binding protein
MYLRLAFAVAAHLEPEILLVDEVLAVGDAAFQKKCLGKIGEVAKDGRTVLFVSHNIGAIVQLCGRALWFENGMLKFDGYPADVAGSYLSSETVARSTWSFAESARGKLVQMKAVHLLDQDNQSSAVMRFDQPFKIQIAYEIADANRNLFLLCRLSDSQGTVLWTSWDTDTTDWSSRTRKPGSYLSICSIPGRLFKPGHYLLSVGASDTTVFEYYEHVLAFDISEVGYHLNPGRMGIITPLLQWEIVSNGHRPTS